MVLVIDNYDSFTYNLVQYLGELGAKVSVVRNDATTVDAVAALGADRIVISPGPGRPEEAGVTMEVIRQLGGTVPMLGVCLGHQAIGAVYGGSVVRAPAPMHGKTSLIEHNGRGVFSGLSHPFPASRYHSLVVSPDGLPDSLEVTAWTNGPSPNDSMTNDQMIIMGLRHRTLPVCGVQFHPESILTGEGHQLLRNFLDGRLD
ncbi:MAG: aminodeoxychorismate/anthranilate synthase component II [Acidobacteriaceae bacterium]|jgi:anthranilate synthase component 2|nr:aminodeoxychorismate/anthranilate synthase component II [Acidobacteriaceae bacterium]